VADRLVDHPTGNVQQLGVNNNSAGLVLLCSAPVPTSIDLVLTSEHPSSSPRRSSSGSEQAAEVRSDVLGSVLSPTRWVFLVW
jgi:hypothetical protein